MNISLDPNFDDHFAYMTEVLRLLCDPAVKQCEVMGSFNTGWEIRADAVSMIEAVVASPACDLSVSEVQVLRGVQSMVASLPPEAISVPGYDMKTRESCEIVMKHPSWELIREEARRAVDTLQVRILIHRGRYFYGADD